MPRILKPETFHPNLKFRYRATMEGADGMGFYARAIDLPTWDEKVEWSTPIKIKCYHFEGITAIELYNIKKKDVSLNIELLDPTGQNAFSTWKMVGDIIRVKFGECDYGLDDVIEAEVTFVAKKVEFEFLPKEVKLV